MKIRKFTALNTHEAIAKVKYELGSEALIINTKKVRQKGLLGYFKKPMIEVMAAIDEQSREKTKYPSGQNHGNSVKLQTPEAQNDVFAQFQSQLKTIGKSPESAPSERGWDFDMHEGVHAADAHAKPWSDQNGVRARESLEEPSVQSEFTAVYASAPTPETREINRGRAIDAYSGTTDDTPPQGTIGVGLASPARAVAERRSVVITKNERGSAFTTVSDADLNSNLEIKIENIEAMLSKVYREVSIASKIAEADNEKLAPLSKVLRLFYGNLVRNEVEPEFSMNIIERVNDSLQSEENSYDAATVLYNEVSYALGKPETINIRQDKKPTVAIFIGPTGVGKTTTLAKIAADSALNRGLDVAMITADTYRIAAVQQLKTYAEILGIPVLVAYAPGEIKSRIAELSDKDLILIDTAGRSHRRTSQFDELRELVDEAGADEVFLVLSATTSISNSREIIRNYQFLDDFKLIFTKADETPVFGSMLNARMLTGKRLSYVTVGQSVPDDIEVASIEKITRNLIGSMTE